MAILKDTYFDGLSPIIEYIDPIRNNLSDSSKVHFTVKGDPTEVIKWCRKNFGERGDGWDFSGGTKVQITIWSSKLEFMWRMWQE